MGIDGQENEKLNDSEAEPVVQESIKPKYKKKLKKLLEVVVLAIVAGVVFGLTVRLFFGITPSQVNRIINQNSTETEGEGTPAKRSEVTLQPAGSVTAAPAPTKVADNEKQPVSFDGNKTDKPDTNPSKPGPGQTEASDKPGDVASASPKPTEAADKNQNEIAADKADGQEKTDDSEQTGDKHPVVVITSAPNDKEPVPTTSVSLSGNEEKTDGNGSDASGNPIDIGNDGRDETKPDGSLETTGDTANGDSDADEKNDGEADTINTEGTDSSDSAEDGKTNPDDENNPVAGDDENGSEEKTESSAVMPEFSLESYRKLMDELHKVADEAGKGIVTIKSATSIVNWMGENVENTSETVGGIVADNGVELLIVTYYDKVKNSDRIEVTLATGSKYEGTMLATDAGYNMAVIAVPLKAIAEEELEAVKPVVFGNTANIYAGMPIIAIGSPNGSIGSVEYGYITGCGKVRYVTDGVCSLFTTDITNSTSSEGVVLNLDGELIGIISRNAASGTSTEISVESLLLVAQRLCNEQHMPYFGIMAEDVPESALKDLKLEHGIYVDEVSVSSPAAAADIHKGDIIVEVNNISIGSVKDFSSILMDTEAGEAIDVKIFRSSQMANPELVISVIPE